VHTATTNTSLYVDVTDMHISLESAVLIEKHSLDADGPLSL